MKILRVFLLSILCLVLALGMANATINLDETFDDGAPFTDLNFAYGNANPTSATVKGMNIYRDADASTTGALAFNFTSPNAMGSLVNLGTGDGKAWKLSPNERIFFGQSGVAHVPSGIGEIGNNGDGISVSQIAVSFEPATANKPEGTNVGSISYYFGGTTASTHTLVYNLVCGTSGSINVASVRDGVAGPTVGSLEGNKWALITTVWCSKQSDTDNSQYWSTIPKTAYGSNEVGHEGWLYNKAPHPNAPVGQPAGTSWEGSADGRLYPNGKGWPFGTRLTSSTLGTTIYTFVGTNPVGVGTTSTAAMVVDNPWVLNGIFAANGGKIRTWRIQAGPADAMYIDDLYLEGAYARDRTPTDPFNQAADYRLHAFNKPYDTPGGLPVELSTFELR